MARRAARSALSAAAAAGSDGDPTLYSVIAPTYNEAQNVPLLAALLDEACAAAGLAYELVVVDDGSPDGTADVRPRRGGGGGAARAVRGAGGCGAGALARGVGHAWMLWVACRMGLARVPFRRQRRRRRPARRQAARNCNRHYKLTCGAHRP
jgi:hypothetical protein